ncbi:MAG: PAS domain S-box protein, partial [Bacteroidetes bacterium]|nr:PAS domain S-box protein [Bacteroidota bacterium]
MDLENIADTNPTASLINLSDYNYIETLPVAICICDTEGVIKKINRKTVELFGNSISTSIGTSISEYFKPYSPNNNVTENSLLQLASDNADKIIELTFQNKNFSIILKAALATLKDGQNRITGTIICFEDITDAIQGQQALQESEHKYQELITSLEKEIENSTAELVSKNEALKRSEERYHKMVDEVEDYAILLLDKDGFIQNWNKGAEKIKGYSEAEIIGKNFRIFYRPEDQAVNLPERLIETARKNGKAIHEGWRVRKNGTNFWGSIVITALHDEKGDIIGFSKVTRDLTEKKLAEDKLKRYAEELKFQNSELQQFAYVASHDLQEPLRKIKTFSDLLISKYENELDEEGRSMLERMQVASDRMKVLITDLLNYSRISRMLDKTLLDTNKEVEDVLTDLDTSIKDKKAVINIKQLYPIYGNSTQIRQLFQNLISNALKFSKPGVAPHIDISARIVHGYEADFALPEEKLQTKFQYIEISDNGIGFEQQYAEKIFQ